METPELIVVMSPDATTLRGLRRALAASGFDVEAALDWMETISALRRRPVSLQAANPVEVVAAELVQIGHQQRDGAAAERGYRLHPVEGSLHVKPARRERPSQAP